MRIRSLISSALLAATVSLGSLHAQELIHHGTGRYQLRANDEIKVSYHITPDLNATVSVQPDGYIVLPEIGDVRVAGLTVDEATEVITKKASQRLNAPEVTLTITKFEKPHFFVGGYVGKPGKFTLDGPITALQAVQMAEGIKDTGNQKHVILIRPIGDGVGETHVLNLKRSGNGKNTQEFFVEDGDTIVVPESTFTAVARYVKLINPGIYYPIVN
jgi:polysaccharide biosynthesis/export protein